MQTTQDSCINGTLGSHFSVSKTSVKDSDIANNPNSNGSVTYMLTLIDFLSAFFSIVRSPCILEKDGYKTSAILPSTTPIIA